MHRRHVVVLPGLLSPHLEGPTARRVRSTNAIRALAGPRVCEAGGSGDRGILRRGRLDAPDDDWIDIDRDHFWERPGVYLPRLYRRYRDRAGATWT